MRLFERTGSQRSEEPGDGPQEGGDDGSIGAQLELGTLRAGW